MTVETQQNTTSSALAGAVERVDVKDVTKLFGAKRALCNVSLCVEQGEVVALTGQNGAGKSTLLSILSTIMKPTFGSFEINSKPAGAHSRAQIGYLSHKPFVYPELTCEENLELFASLYNLGSDAVLRMRTQLNLAEFFSDRPTGVLSRGQLQRVALARALIAAPNMLLLDEPTSGLDRASTGLIETIVGEHKKMGGITFLVSHDPTLVAKLSTKVVLLQMGKVVVEAEGCSEGDVEKMLAEGMS